MKRASLLKSGPKRIIKIYAGKLYYTFKNIQF
jgi:hypothetical protein